MGSRNSVSTHSSGARITADVSSSRRARTLDGSRCCSLAVNLPLVERKITLILDDLQRVAELAAIGVDAYVADLRNEVLAERYLERIIGRVIDINFHLVTEVLGTTPKDYADSFLQLVPAGVLDREAASGFVRLAGLRTRITHEYTGIDERRIHQSLGRVAAELPAYLKSVKAFLARA